jgi:2-dehydropantoate 2-reductase
MKLRTIAVIGAGPVGGILSAHLHAAGHQVILIDSWKEHLEHIRIAGLHISGNEELLARPVSLLDSITDLGRFAPEFVFICTKACDLDIVLNQLDDKIKKSNAVFISAQNGIDTEEVIAEKLGRDRILRAIITFGGVLIGPGEIRETFFNPPTYLGWMDERAADSCREVAEIVSDAGLEMEATPEIRKHVWKKAILNSCTMAPAAVTGMDMQEVIDFPPTNQLVELMLHESIAAAAADGFDFGPGFFEMVTEFNKRAGPHRPSMLVDLEKKRKTENSFLIRRIAEYAEKKGVPAPVHRTLANIIDALEKRGLELKTRTN